MQEPASRYSKLIPIATVFISSLSIMMREIWGDLSEEEARSLPSDGAEQADHYIYGTPKRKL